jgi:hypothetical protein
LTEETTTENKDLKTHSNNSAVFHQALQEKKKVGKLAAKKSSCKRDLDRSGFDF